MHYLQKAYKSIIKGMISLRDKYRAKSTKGKMRKKVNHCVSETSFVSFLL